MHDILLTGNCGVLYRHDNPRKPINLISVLSLIFKSDVTELSGNKELERLYLSFSLHKKKKGRERLTKLPIDKARKVF